MRRFLSQFLKLKLSQVKALKAILQVFTRILLLRQVLAHRCAYLNGLIGKPRKVA
jgi:hypothetical protein